MIAHHRERGAGVHHSAGDVDGADLCRTAIHEIANEDYLALLMPPGAGPVTIAERAEQCLELVRLPVDVADDVVGHDR